MTAATATAWIGRSGLAAMAMGGAGTLLTLGVGELVDR